MSDARAAVVATAQAMSRAGLAPGTTGNVSARLPDGGAGGGRFLVTPTAMPYDGLVPDDIVEMDLATARVTDGRRAPSSEWRLHLEILRARPDVGAVVHTHSMFSVTLACLRRPIPAFHYMIAVAGGTDVRCAEYATYGSAELARNAVAALADRQACLLANHGLVAVGPDLGRALRIAEQVETLAEQYWRALQIGRPFILDDDEMARVIEKLAGYRQPG